MIRNIIFDWSGTLVDDLPAVWKATNYALVQAQRTETSLEQFRAEFCLPFTIFYDKHTPNVPLPQLEAWFHGQLKQVQDSVCELPHARELDARIVSNDRFRDRLSAFPDAGDRLIRYMIVEREVVLERRAGKRDATKAKRRGSSSNVQL